MIRKTKSGGGALFETAHFIRSFEDLLKPTLFFLVQMPGVWLEGEDGTGRQQDIPAAR